MREELGIIKLTNHRTGRAVTEHIFVGDVMVICTNHLAQNDEESNMELAKGTVVVIAGLGLSTNCVLVQNGDVFHEMNGIWLTRIALLKL